MIPTTLDIQFIIAISSLFLTLIALIFLIFNRINHNKNLALQFQNLENNLQTQFHNLLLNQLQNQLPTQLQTQLQSQLQTQFQNQLLPPLQALKEDNIERFGILSQNLERRLGEHSIQQTKISTDMQRIISENLARNNLETSSRFKDLSLQVEQRLNEGFEKTTATFSDIVKRLALIDDAQKKLTELSTNVVSLQEILIDKRSRGAFGEIQLKNLVQNMLPPDNFAFQYTLSNGNRADCILFLPEPTGNIIIDSKFPLENYQIMTDFSNQEQEKKKASQAFKQDIKKHVMDIASKYIQPEETSEGAIMFIPAEAVFAEIHAHFPELVELAQRSNVWLASPTTLMAILTTARAVLKDSATRKHIHIIQEHLRMLARDFGRFETRMQHLAKHIEKANHDVQQVHTSAKKITRRFGQIDKCEVGQGLETLELDFEVESQIENELQIENEPETGTGTNTVSETELETELEKSETQ
jgi:DNA recombination protein RmuC